MPGPPPKDPAIRRRRNKTSTAARLPMDGGDAVDTPELPPRVIEVEGVRTEDEWHPLAVELWEDVWASPMAPEYLDADVHGLVVLVALTDAYWRRMESGQVSGANELAKELRLQRQAFGLSPIDRRRLQWEVDRGEEAETKRQKRQRKIASEAPPLPSGDGFAALR
jgi:hypothetical protein